MSSTGAPITTGTVFLTSTTPAAVPSLLRGRVTAGGAFTLSSVPPGEYRLELEPSPRAPTAREVASMPVTVSGQDITGSALVTAPTATASGRIVFDGGTPVDQPRVQGRPLLVSAVAATGGAISSGNSVRVRDDWTFELAGRRDREIFRIINAPAGWSLGSIRFDGADVTDSGIDFKPGQTVEGIEIVLTRNVTELSGTVQDARGRPVTDYVVVAFAPDSAKWSYPTRRVRSGRASEDGRFVIRELPPDDYLLVALEFFETGDEMDPEQLEKWKSKGTPVTLAAGESKSINLKLTR